MKPGSDILSTLCLLQKADVQIPDLCLALKPASNTISSSSSGSYTLIYAPA